MTQCIIPGCERNPDPSTVINVDPTKPMKEINMNETKNNVDNNEAFKQFLATGTTVIETCRELLEENERLRKENNDIKVLMNEHQIPDVQDLVFVLENYDKFKDIASDMECVQNCDPDELRSKVEALKNNGSSVPADYQTLKDYKDCIDSIYDEYDIPKDVEELRKALDEYESIKCRMDDHGISDADDLDNYLDECADFEKYKKGFEALSEFVENLNGVIGSHGDDIPSTDVEDYD